MLNTDTWRRTLAAFTRTRVLVIGDVMLDVYLTGEVRRLCPEAPVPVVEACHRTVVPGGAANAASNIAALGGRVALGGVIGQDAAGSELRAALTKAGVAAAGLLAVVGRPTTSKTRVLARTQQMLRIDDEGKGALPMEDRQRLLAWARLELAQCDVLLLSDYNKGVLEPELVGELLGAADARGIPAVVDPKGLAYGHYRGATIIKPNLAELATFYGQPFLGEENVRAAADRLKELLPGTAVLLTRGAEGMSLFATAPEAVNVAAAPVHRVYDVTGAGDTVSGVLALALGAGLELQPAVELANVAAGIVVSKVGTARASLEELTTALETG